MQCCLVSGEDGSSVDVSDDSECWCVVSPLPENQLVLNNSSCSVLLMLCCCEAMWRYRLQSGLSVMTLSKTAAVVCHTVKCLGSFSSCISMAPVTWLSWTLHICRWTTGRLTWTPDLCQHHQVCIFNTKGYSVFEDYKWIKQRKSSTETH